MLKFKQEYHKAKEYVINNYDIVACSGDKVEEESDFFTCPECNYPIYVSDYDDVWGRNRALDLLPQLRFSLV